MPDLSGNRASESPDRVLCRLLERIGRKSRGLDLEDLGSYVELVTLRCVLARALDSSDTERARAAVSLLKDGVAELPTRELRLVGDAALAIAEVYRGLNIEYRKKALSDEHGISEDTYKHLRPQMYRRLTSWIIEQERRANAGLILSEATEKHYLQTMQSVWHMRCLLWVMEAIVMYSPSAEQMWSTQWPREEEDLTQTMVLHLLYDLGALSVENEWFLGEEERSGNSNISDVPKALAGIFRLLKLTELDLARLRSAVEQGHSTEIDPISLADVRLKSTWARCCRWLEEVLNEEVNYYRHHVWLDGRPRLHLHDIEDEMNYLILHLLTYDATFAAFTKDRSITMVTQMVDLLVPSDPKASDWWDHVRIVELAMSAAVGYINMIRPRIIEMRAPTNQS